MNSIGPDDLPPQQRQVVFFISQGLSLKATADKMKVALKTVEYHWLKARKNIGLFEPVLVAHWALATKLIQPIFEATVEMRPVVVRETIKRKPRRRYSPNDKYGDRVCTATFIP